MEIQIHGVSHDGEGVGRAPSGQVVFVSGALPGDTALVELTTKHKSVQHAKTVEILEPSKQRVVSRCTVLRCGGCPLTSLSLEGQVAIKKDRIESTLTRIGKVAIPENFSFVEAPSAWNYRHRVRLHAHWSGESWRLGYHARQSNEVVPYGGCPVLWPELDKFITRLLPAIHRLPQKIELQEVEAVWSRTSKRGGLRLVVGNHVEFFRDSTDWMDSAGLTGLDVSCEDTSVRFGNCEFLYDQTVGDYDLSFESGMFTQANPEMNDALVRRVVAAVSPMEKPRVMELHAGIGNFSLPLCAMGAEVSAFEINPKSSVQAQENADRSELSWENVCIRDVDAIERLSEFDILLLDPPRSGAREVAKKAARPGSGPARIVYVSCDPATLARDIALLVKGGFELVELTGFEMFPGTPHVEVLAVLERS